MQSSVMQTHLCQAHSSSAKSPTHPRNGVFSCDQAVQDLCRWFSRTVYRTRLSSRVPGFIFGYGAYNKKYLARLRKGVSTITSTTVHRSVKPLHRDAAHVAPRSFPFVVISGAEAGSPPFSFEWDVDHPSSYAYAGSYGGLRGALEGLSYALTLVSRLSHQLFSLDPSRRESAHLGGMRIDSQDRALEERVLLAGMPQTAKAKKKSFFQRKARAIYRTHLWGHRIACSLDAEWDLVVSNAYRAALQRCERLTLSDSDAADACKGFSSLAKLATMLGMIRLASDTGEEAKQ